jgi:hypothetical protein
MADSNEVSLLQLEDRIRDWDSNDWKLSRLTIVLPVTDEAEEKLLLFDSRRGRAYIPGRDRGGVDSGNTSAPTNESPTCERGISCSEW